MCIGVMVHLIPGHHDTGERKQWGNDAIKFLDGRAEDSGSWSSTAKNK